MLARCSKLVFRCFKWMERSADYLTGAVGPVFIGVAVTLIFMGVFSFFAHIAPTLSYPIISIPICILLASNLVLHYYWVCTVPPGYIEDDPAQTTEIGSSMFSAKRPKITGATWSERRIVSQSGRPSLQCKKCRRPRPDRAHHCSICKRCILKYDHHCPWINQCVGLRNERHFVLFMAYLVICSSSFVWLGYDQAWEALKFDPVWNTIMPRFAFILIYVISLALGIAVFIMLSWQLYLISSGITTVENYDHDRYRKIAKQRGMEFVNSYHLGARQNIKNFLNVGSGGFSWWTVVIPSRVPPYTDGWSFARRAGMTEHTGILAEDEYTDDDGDGP